MTSPADAPVQVDPLSAYLARCRALVLDELRALLPEVEGPVSRMYRLMLDYPLREAKGLRPALAIATCRAFGGRLEGVLRSASVLELFHNAFLVHDDIEDASDRRRGEPTLHVAHGVPVAINVGDAMLAMTLQPLLDNTWSLGLGPALEILEAIGHMSRQTVEGQAVELEWITGNVWDIDDDDYVAMVVGKTGWYSFITPVLVGAIAAGASQEAREKLAAFARELAVAFQIQDDVLNLVGDEGETGKERAGDLWEGKRTLMLLQMLRLVSAEDRERAKEVLSRPRPVEGDRPLAALIDALVRSGECSPTAAAQLRAAVGAGGAPRSAEDVDWLLARIEATDGVAHARARAATHAATAAALLEEALAGLPPSEHADFLRALVAFVSTRSR